MEPIDPKKILSSNSTKNQIVHMQEILDALIESVISKKDAMPFLLRFFLKCLYQECL